MCIYYYYIPYEIWEGVELWEFLEDLDLLFMIRLDGVILLLLGSLEILLLSWVIVVWGAVTNEKAETGYDIGQNYER